MASMDSLEQTGENEKIEKVDGCQHPAEYISQGANQYGRWQKCCLCQKKISFTRYSSTNPRPAQKKQLVTVDLPTTPQPKVRGSSDQNYGTPSGTSGLISPDDEKVKQIVREEVTGQLQNVILAVGEGISRAMSPLIGLIGEVCHGVLFSRLPAVPASEGQ